ncbi:helix-turn-helix transcriptional regulator [Nonomuraea sp. NPDC005692]|uniref:helix-turn-helix transcriptional regulator n=1 Tax=Nonomuraea sp. NPDC005692 TaxID=3157168 RepID=UPI0033F9ADEA
MIHHELPQHLVHLGISERAALAYTTLLKTGPISVEAVADELLWDVADAQESAEQLVKLGLAAGSGVVGATLTPTEPAIALQRLVHERAAELQEAQIVASNAYFTYRRTVHPQATEDLVEVVTGPQIIERIHAIEGAAESQVLRFDSPPYHTHGEPNEEEIRNLDRNVEYRVVYSRSAVQNSDYYACNISPCIASGEQARVLPTVPVKLTVFDRRVAFVSMSFVEAEINDSMLIVRPSSLLSALIGLFETSWRSAFPMHLGEQEPPALKQLQRQILKLLATGITDENIAELLGISRRTLSRHLEQLTYSAGATTRFQLALYASRKGWI